MIILIKTTIELAAERAAQYFCNHVKVVVTEPRDFGRIRSREPDPAPQTNKTQIVFHSAGDAD